MYIYTEQLKRNNNIHTNRWPNRRAALVQRSHQGGLRLYWRHCQHDVLGRRRAGRRFHLDQGQQNTRAERRRSDLHFGSSQLAPVVHLRRLGLWWLRMPGYQHAGHHGTRHRPRASYQAGRPHFQNQSKFSWDYTQPLTSSQSRQ